MASQRGHRWFAAVWDWQTRHEPSWLRGWREEIAGGARGQVLEIGCGGGANFSYYGTHASHVVATEPDPYMLERAQRRASESTGKVEARRASAEELPFDDSSFDSVVSTFNMCSIPDAAKALAEIRRVLKPGGEYRFADHVRFNSGFGGWVQDTVTPVWKWCGAGCHPNRDLEAMIRESALNIVQIDRLNPLPPIPPVIIIRPSIKGVAVRP